MDEDWTVLRSFLPAGWEEFGRSTGALKGLRKDKSAESVLRVLLLHLGCGQRGSSGALSGARGRPHPGRPGLRDGGGAAPCVGGGRAHRGAGEHRSVVAADPGRRTARPGARAAKSSPRPLPLQTMSSSSPPFAKTASAPARFWNGIACAGRSNWSSNASSPWRSWATCPSATTRAPAPGSTASFWWRCWSTSWSVTPAPFPPGDTTWRRRRPHSPWREFRFVLNQIRRAIEPAFGLARTIDEWNDIAKALSEPPRRRRPQRATHFNP